MLHGIDPDQDAMILGCGMDHTQRSESGSKIKRNAWLSEPRKDVNQWTTYVVKIVYLQRNSIQRNSSNTYRLPGYLTNFSKTQTGRTITLTSTKARDPDLNQGMESNATRKRYE
jgi:hypothetical protein